ncbi:MAG: AraC family transcriptional regulator [Pseudomonadota bacterium]
MANLITRHRMAEIMEHRHQATVQERPTHQWRRVDTAVVRQSSVECSGTLDFHLLELCLSGRIRSGPFRGTEQGDDLMAEHLPGSLAYFQDGIPQSFSIEGDYVVQQIYIDRSIFLDTARSLDLEDPASARPLGFHGIFEPRIKALADVLLEEARNPSAGGDLYVDAIAHQIAVLILRRRYDGTANQAPRRRTLSPTELVRVSEHLEADLADTGGLDTLAALLDMDTFAFTRAFKETTGQAPHQYLIDRRIARVKDMLLEDREGLVEIAYVTGFSSQSHMTATFKQRVGVSPGRWRAATRGVSGGATRSPDDTDETDR